MAEVERVEQLALRSHIVGDVCESEEAVGPLVGGVHRHETDGTAGQVQTGQVGSHADDLVEGRIREMAQRRQVDRLQPRQRHAQPIQVVGLRQEVLVAAEKQPVAAGEIERLELWAAGEEDEEVLRADVDASKGDVDERAVPLALRGRDGGAREEHRRHGVPQQVRVARRVVPLPGDERGALAIGEVQEAEDVRHDLE